MEATYAWCNGASFLEVCKLANTFEGSIIRCLRRLDELLRQLSEAAKSIGNTVYLTFAIFAYMIRNWKRSSKRLQRA